jgi:hypothetical protein
MDRAVVAAHESTVDRPHNLNGYAILFVHHKSHSPGRVQAGVVADSPECGGTRRRVRRRDPRSHCRASFRACVGSTRSGSKCAHIQGFKGVACAPTAAGTERGRRGARRRAGAGAAACARDEKRRGYDAHRTRMV